ncbi:zinc finger protein-like protein [Leptotrombidium deliense]|uniref:Zinc finger protein-like protein n=1 Tax=Leptotrombidium deliense TaxID=299467 RepID=A0A443S005_9ACAR|nr:zinc finger protein-like protein [Leptotrombidium deliense]
MDIDCRVENMIADIKYIGVKSEAKLQNSVTNDDDNETSSTLISPQFSVEKLRSLCLNSNVKVMLRQNMMIDSSGECSLNQENERTEKDGVFKVKINEFKGQILPKMKKVYRTKQYVAVHIVAVHKKANLFECNLCDKKYSRYSTLPKHSKRVHSNFRKNTDFTRSISEKFNIYERMKNENVDQIWKQMCKGSVKIIKDKLFREFNDQIGRTKVNGVGKYHCKHCEKTFYSRLRAVVHILRIHRNEKRFECELCSQKYISPDTLMLHVKSIHTNLNDLKCDKIDEERKNDETINDEKSNQNITPFGSNASNILKNMTNNVDVDLECIKCNIVFTCQTLRRFHFLKLHSENIDYEM